MLAVFLVVVGCARARLDSAFQSWHGATLPDLVRAWGPPDRTDTLPNGDREIKYRVDGGTVQNPHQAWRVSIIFCDATATVGADDVIKRFRWHGDGYFCGQVIKRRGGGPRRP